MTRLVLALLVLTLACNNAPEEEDGRFDFGDTDADTTNADGDGYAAGEDCDDADAGVYPGATERCNGVDDDCDGAVDDGVGSTYYADVDGDGFGDDSLTRMACEAPEGFVTRAGDCDDVDDSVYPGAGDVCDGIDTDCDGEIDPVCEYTRIVGTLQLSSEATACEWDAEGIPDTTRECPACDFAFEVVGSQVYGSCVSSLDTVMGWDDGAETWNIYWDGVQLGILDGTITYGDAYDRVVAQGLSVGDYMLYGEFRIY